MTNQWWLAAIMNTGEVKGWRLELTNDHWGVGDGYNEHWGREGPADGFNEHWKKEGLTAIVKPGEWRS